MAGAPRSRRVVRPVIVLGDGSPCKVLSRIVNLYIEFAELQALERKPMTMRGWVDKLDEFLKASGRKLLDHAGTIST